MFFWGLWLPLAALGAASLIGRPGLLPLALYPALGLRITLRHRRGGWPLRHAALWAASCVVGKFPQLLGALGRARGTVLTISS